MKAATGLDRVRLPGLSAARAGENLSEKGRGREKSRLKPYQDGGDKRGENPEI